MKTLGEILSTARRNKKFSQQDIADITKIEIKHIKSLESDNYSSLPPVTFTKGFIRNFAKAVDKDPDSLVAIYRRDAKEKIKQSPPPGAGSNLSIKKAFISTPKSTIALVLVGLTVFTAYLSFQYRAVIIPPPLTITQPSPSAVVTSPMTIEGKTSSDSLVTINEETRIKPDQSGVFITQLNLAPGEYEFTITATNRYSRSASQTLTISVISQ